MARITKSEQQDAIARLAKELKPGANIYVKMNRSTNNGTHFFSVYLPTTLEYTSVNGGKVVLPHIWDCTFLVSKATGYQFSDKRTSFGEIQTGEWGSDIVGAIGRALYPNGVSEELVQIGWSYPEAHREALTDGYYAFNLERL